MSDFYFIPPKIGNQTIDGASVFSSFSSFSSIRNPTTPHILQPILIFIFDVPFCFICPPVWKTIALNVANPKGPVVILGNLILGNHIPKI